MGRKYYSNDGRGSYAEEVNLASLAIRNWCPFEQFALKHKEDFIISYQELTIDPVVFNVLDGEVVYFWRTFQLWLEYSLKTVYSLYNTAFCETQRLIYRSPKQLQVLPMFTWGCGSLLLTARPSRILF